MSRNRVVDLSNFSQFTAINVLSDPGHIGGPVIIPSCARIMLVWTLTNAKTVRQILVGRYAGTFNGTPSQAQAILTALTTGTQWTNLAAFMPTTGALARVELLDINTANNTAIASTGGPAAGSSASAALPGEVQLVATLRTARTGPQNRGRSYIPNWATNALGATDLVASAAVTAAGVWASNWIANFAASGYTLVVGQPARAAYTGSTGTQHPARAAGSQPVTSVIIRDNHWDTQRRRGLK